MISTIISMVISRDIRTFNLPFKRESIIDLDVLFSITHGIREYAKPRIFLITFSSNGDWHSLNALHKNPAKKRDTRVIAIVITAVTRTYPKSRKLTLSVNVPVELI